MKQASKNSSGNLGERVATETPLSIKKTKGNDFDLPGEGKRNREACAYASQGGISHGFSIPLVSCGFSRCWAAVVYDHDTSRSFLIHVDDFYLKTEQKIIFERFLKGEGKRSAIVIYGKDSYGGVRESGLEKYGCTIERTIQVHPGNYHWGLAYYPDRNQIEVAIKDPMRVFTLPGVREGVWDKDRRAQIDEGMVLAERIASVANGLHGFPGWFECSGRVPLGKMQEFVDEVARILSLPQTFPFKEIFERNKIAFKNGEEYVFPRGLHYCKDTKEYHRFDSARQRKVLKLTFTLYEDPAELHRSLIWKNRENIVSVDRTFLHVRDPSTGGEGVVHLSSNELHFFGVKDTPEDRAVAYKLVDGIRGEMVPYFRTEMDPYTIDNKIPSAEEIEEMHVHNAKIKAWMDDVPLGRRRRP